jgi:hypothetical protein
MLGSSKFLWALAQRAYYSRVKGWRERCSSPSENKHLVAGSDFLSWKIPPLAPQDNHRAAWLTGRKLTVSLSERNELANVSNEDYFGIIRELGGPEDKRAVKQFSDLKSLPFKLDSKARKMVRDFTEFSNRSGGFWVS